MTWDELDWEALARLRRRFIGQEPFDGPYWESESEIASYDFTYGERIGWKWDHVVRELRLRGWHPPAGPVLDWGCGTAVAARRCLARVPGVEVLNENFFNEFTIRVKGDASQLVERLAAQRILAGVPVSRLLPRAGLDDLLLIASTETNTDDDRAALVAALSSQLAH